MQTYKVWNENAKVHICIDTIAENGCAVYRFGTSVDTQQWAQPVTVIKIGRWQRERKCQNNQYLMLILF